MDLLVREGSGEITGAKGEEWEGEKGEKRVSPPNLKPKFAHVCCIWLGLN